MLLEHRLTVTTAAHMFATALPLQFITASPPSIYKDGFWHLVEAGWAETVEQQPSAVTQSGECKWLCIRE